MSVGSSLTPLGPQFSEGCHSCDVEFVPFLKETYLNQLDHRATKLKNIKVYNWHLIFLKSCIKFCSHSQEDLDRHCFYVSLNKQH